MHNYSTNTTRLSCAMEKSLAVRLIKKTGMTAGTAKLKSPWAKTARAACQPRKNFDWFTLLPCFLLGRNQWHRSCLDHSNPHARETSMMNNSRVMSLTSPGEAWVKHLRKVSQGIVKTRDFSRNPAMAPDSRSTVVAPSRLRQRIS